MMHFYSEWIKSNSLLPLLLVTTTNYTISKDNRILLIRLKKKQLILVKIVIIINLKDSILMILTKSPLKAKNHQGNHKPLSVVRRSLILNRGRLIKNTCLLMQLHKN